MGKGFSAKGYRPGSPLRLLRPAVTLPFLTVRSVKLIDTVAKVGESALILPGEGVAGVGMLPHAFKGGVLRA